MRVLVVGNADERRPGRRYYSVERKLANGFIRNGHSVLFFSDRDVARAGTIWRSSRAGRGAANAKFLEAARLFQPEAVVLMHACLLATDTLAEAKAGASRPRLAQVCVDPLFRPVNVAFLTDRARVTDATFVTTGGAALRRFSTANNVSAFIPNPVDSSVETLRNFEAEELGIDVFFAANASDDRADDPRRAIPRALRARATPGLACGFYGFDGTPGLYGAEYFEALARARMGLNLNSDRAETATTPAPAEELHLYNSDRLAQLTGCGLLTLSLRVGDAMTLYEDGREMVFAEGVEDMREAVLRYKGDDAARRRIAEAGWRRAHADYNERRVATFIEDVLFRRSKAADAPWPTALW